MATDDAEGMAVVGGGKEVMMGREAREEAGGSGYGVG